MTGTTRSAPVRRPQRGAWAVRVAAVVAALIVASGLVVRLSVALVSGSPQAQAALTGGGGELTIDTDAGSSPVFDEVTLTPGQTVSSCVRVATRSSGDVAPIRLRLEGSGSTTLADHLLVDVATGVDDTDCVAGVAIWSGTRAAQLDGDGLWADAPTAGFDDRWYRIDVVLDPEATDDVQSLAVEDLALRWDTELVETATLSLPRRSTLFATGVAERSIIPLLWLLALSVGFVGIQSRIDRHDPKLAAAPVDVAELEFDPR